MIPTVQIFFSYKLQTPRERRFGSPDQNLNHDECALHFSVEAFVSNALLCRRLAEAPLRRCYEFDCVNASLFTTYGILVGSPP